MLTKGVRLSKNLWVLNSRSTASNAVAFGSVTNLRFFATDKSSTTKSPNETTKLDKQRPARSILEEVLIKEEEEPKTTAQKGKNLLVYFEIFIILVKRGAENTFFYAALGVSVMTLGGLSWLLFDYFFSGGSPQRVYGKGIVVFIRI